MSAEYREYKIYLFALCHYGQMFLSLIRKLNSSSLVRFVGWAQQFTAIGDVRIFD